MIDESSIAQHLHIHLACQLNTLANAALADDDLNLPRSVIQLRMASALFRFWVCSPKFEEQALNSGNIKMKVLRRYGEQRLLTRCFLCSGDGVKVAPYPSCIQSSPSSARNAATVVHFSSVHLYDYVCLSEVVAMMRPAMLSGDN
jgi:hypothetical protein